MKITAENGKTVIDLEGDAVKGIRLDADNIVVKNGYYKGDVIVTGSYNTLTDIHCEEKKGFNGALEGVPCTE